MRQAFVNEICNSLKDINQSQGHLLIHGMAGSGKTIAVCQSIRMVFEQGCFRSHGVYWVKLGELKYICYQDLIELVQLLCNISLDSN